MVESSHKRNPYIEGAALCAPFASWIILMTVLPQTAAAYAIRTAASAVVLAISALWYGKFCLGTTLKSLLIGIAAGIAVSVMWILPEVLNWSFYLKYLIWPIGEITQPPEQSPYDPSVCGNILTAAKIVGSAFVIAPAEEMFFRSFIYRQFQDEPFENCSITKFDAKAFLFSAVLFSLEHDRFAAAFICAGVYGILAIRLGLASAIAAHCTTNLLLGVWIVRTGQWQFW